MRCSSYRALTVIKAPVAPIGWPSEIPEPLGLTLAGSNPKSRLTAQACAVSRDLGLAPAKVNPNGSGISLGHPIGATGALLTVKAVYELQRIQGRYALVTMCIGGGQGIAAIFERI